MNYQELLAKVSKLFPRMQSETVEHHDFFLEEALAPFVNYTDCSRVWDHIKAYDGNSNRPKLAFFLKIASGSCQGDKDFTYYQCSCGQKLNQRSAGGCPICHKTDSVVRFSKQPVHVLPAQSGCFDCSVYTQDGGHGVMGPSCPDFGKPEFETCQMRGRCACVHCCRFEYMRSYHPERLRAELPRALKALPKPLSPAGQAFQDGRASVNSVNDLLKHIAKKKQEEDAE